MATAGLRTILRPDREVTFGSVSVGVALGALVYAFVGALGVGSAGWLWAQGTGNPETVSEAADWFLVWAIVGAIAFAPLGAVAGLVQRMWGIWPRRPWLPFIGLTAGISAAIGFGSSASAEAPTILWPFLGLFCGIGLHKLFALLVANR